MLGKLGMNLALMFTNLRKLRIFPAFWGSLAPTTASTRDSVGPMPWMENKYPMKVSFDMLNADLSLFKVSPFS